MFTWLKRRLLSRVRQSPQVAASFSQPHDAGLSGGAVETTRSQAADECAELVVCGDAAVSAGDLNLAVQHYRKALLLKPNDAKLLIVTSFALVAQNLLAEARLLLNRAILLDPDNAKGFFLLGKIARQQGDLTGAIENYNEALEIEPGLEMVFRDLAQAQLMTGNAGLAEATLAQGISTCPSSAQMRLDIGNFYANLNSLHAAIESYRQAVTIDPMCFEAHNNLGVMLVKQGRLTEGMAGFEHVLSVNPAYLPAHTNLIWTLSFAAEGRGGRYLEETRRFGAKVLAQVRPYDDWSKVGDQHGERLRVGFVSGDLRNHPVGIFLEGVLDNLDPAKLELMAYSMNSRDDDLTERVKGRFVQWTSIVRMSDEEVARKIHEDGVDILIDLAGHSAHNRLPVFAWKAAPVQLSWLGYMASTGVPGIDYVLADRVSVPESGRGQFSEKVWHLPETLFCFTPPPEHAKLTVVKPPVLRNGYITFGSFQRISKLSDVTLELWGPVFKAMPDAKLCMRNIFMGSERVRERLMSRLEAVGIESHRIKLEQGLPGREDYLAGYADIDMVLDTFPHPGATTTCEAMWMGVPTVTLGGDTMLSRIGASMLTCAGLSEWVAWSEDEYVELAVKHAQDVAGLTRLRQEMRGRVAETALFDAKRFAPQLEEALLGVWRHKLRSSVGNRAPAP